MRQVMEETLNVTAIQHSTADSGEKLKDFLVAVMVAGASLAVFGCLFNRATGLSYSIGYNLYGAERVLAGEIPYRDFHTLYPPATLYLNAALFKWLGVTLYSAMLGVLVFKVLTILMIYLSGRQIMPRGWALAAAALSLFWLRPNGAFKAVPMQYGELFLALGLFLLLKYEIRRNIILIFLAGASLALLVLFKHNIGAFALLGYFVFTVLERGTFKSEPSLRNNNGLWHAPIVALGVVAVVLPVFVYMQTQGALAPMVRTLVFGPGEFLVSRLPLRRSPVVPVVFMLLCAFAVYRFRLKQTASKVIWLGLIISTSVFVLYAYATNKLIFYLPVFIFVAGLLASALENKVATRKRRALFLVLVFAIAAFVELFPRFAREQAIAAMPFVVLLLLHLLYLFRPAIRRVAGGGLQSKVAIAVFPTVLLLVGADFFSTTYFDGGFRFRSNTELSIERGRGVYFPEAAARQTDEIVRYIQQRVPFEGYIFAQSNGGSPYLFLASRKNPSSAQFWGGVGVTAAQRDATLKEIDHRQVKLIITSDDAMTFENYEPLKEYIEQNFKNVTRFGDVIILER